MSNTVTHVVLVRWKESIPAQISAMLARVLEEVPASMAGIRWVRHGPSVSTEGLEAGYDWGLVIEFEDRSSLADYLPHPAHEPVRTLISAWADEVVVFDVEGPKHANR